MEQWAAVSEPGIWLQAVPLSGRGSVWCFNVLNYSFYAVTVNCYLNLQKTRGR